MTELSKSQPTLILPAFDLSDPASLPDLTKSTTLPSDLTSTYWSPSEVGDFILAYYQGISIQIYHDDKGEEIELPCAIFLVQDQKNKKLSTMRNGSVLLVSTLENSERIGKISIGTPLKITYAGKKKNKNNDKRSTDQWSVQPIIPN